MMLELPPLKWVTSPNFSSRNGAKVRLITIHDCEGSYAGSVAWFSQKRSRVSAHIVLREDGGEATQMVSWAAKAWHVVEFNSISEGIEAAGYAAKGFSEPEWDALAAIVAFRLRANGIPCQKATAANGWTGYCQHVDLGAPGGGHHDITSDPTIRAAFARRVEAAYGQTMPYDWSPKIFMPSHDDRRDAADKAVDAPPVADHPAGPPAAAVFDLDSVAGVQSALNALGYRVTENGELDAHTRNAVLDFQRHMHITVDGDPGQETRAAIRRELARVS